MKIKRFIGTSVNGYLDFDITFFDRITFVTGINGSGKTSALNLIAALLLPRIDHLAGHKFDEITLEISDDDGDVHLSARKFQHGTLLTCTRFPDDAFNIVELDELDSVPPYRAAEHEEEYYNDLLARHSSHPVLTYIQSLPTPMYLGLDRRTLSIGLDPTRYGARSREKRAARWNIFGRSLEAGLSEALYFARDRFQDDRRRELERDKVFLETLVHTLIDFPLFSFSSKLDAPSESELVAIALARANMRRLPTLLNIANEVVSNKLDQVFDFLDKRLETIRHSPANSSEGLHALIEWSINRANVDKISRLSEIISQYNNDINSIMHHRGEYVRTVNGFIRESGKEITFDSIGNLRFMVDGEGELRNIGTLSSGEIQLLVILTHLYFNPVVEKANVFIIDEPELSLHVQWQEQFVDSIAGASSETQFIMATHSPSIILDKIDRCVEISQR